MPNPKPLDSEIAEKAVTTIATSVVMDGSAGTLRQLRSIILRAIEESRGQPEPPKSKGESQ